MPGSPIFITQTDNFSALNFDCTFYIIFFCIVQNKPTILTAEMIFWMKRRKKKRVARKSEKKQYKEIGEKSLNMKRRGLSEDERGLDEEKRV